MASPEGLVAGAWFEWRITGCSCKMFTSFNHLRVWSADLSNIIYHCYVKVVGHKCWVGNVKIQDLKWSECTLLNVYSILVDFSETRRIVKHPNPKHLKCCCQSAWLPWKFTCTRACGLQLWIAVVEPTLKVDPKWIESDCRWAIITHKRICWIFPRSVSLLPKDQSSS
jgi:hypothetical protein